MVPSAIAVLSALPRTSSGQVDRARLPIAAAFGQSGEGAAPRTPLEELLAQQWRDVLRRPAIGITDNFFEAGGHSLLAAQLATRVAGALGVEFPLALLFEHPTIAGLASVLEPRLRGEDAVGDDTMARLVAEIETLSEEEAQRLSGEAWFEASNKT
jgi:hypothetical protein